jgi:hypothetical protein
MTTKPQHSSYWLDQDVFDDDDIETGPSRDETLIRMMRLAAVRRGISNFVNILTNRNDIKVEFSSGRNSYTDGSTVVISADEDANKFDPMVGLALHEAAHIKLSNFQFLTAIQNVRNVVTSGYDASHWNGYTDRDVMNNLFHPALTKTINSNSSDKYARLERLRTAFEDIHTIMNVLEDRRIDKYVYQTAPGYRPYYNALYEKYFFTAEVGKNLRFNPQWRELTVENYINRLIYFFHPANKMDALPGMKKLYKLMDIDTIERVGEPSHDWQTSSKYETMPRLWKDANLIYVHILKFVADAEEAGQKPSNNQSPENGDSTGTPPTPLQDLPNLDMPESSEMVATDVETDKKGKPGKFDPTKAAKEMKKAQEVIAGEAKKKKITKAEAEAISAIEQAQADMVDIKGDGVPFGRCIVLRKLNDKVLEQDWYIFRNHWNSSHKERAIVAGRRMGAILAQRLQVRNDPMMTKQTRLPQGNIDRRLLAQLGMDIEQVFHKSRTDIHRPAMLHLTIDASGSMSGDKWNKTIAVAVALAYVGSKIRNVDTVISIRGGTEIPLVSIIFDSRRDQFQTFMKNVRKIAPAGGTPEGLCFKATLDLVLECADTHDVYFINFSDGEPSFSYTKRSSLSTKDTSGSSSDYYNYGGEHAWNHTRAMIKQIRDRGVKVLSYFISEVPKERIMNTPYSGVRAFKTMYGENAEFINVENAGEVLRTLNKLLLTRGT